MQAGNFHIKQLEGNLGAEVEPLIGTMLTDDHTLAVGKATAADENTVDTNVTNYLVDASFDHASGVVYKQNRDDTSAYDEYEPYDTATDTLYNPASSATDGWIYKQVTETVSGSTKTTNYYLAVSWKITFTYNFSDSEKTKNVGIYLDLNNSNFARKGGDADNDATGAKNSKKGFRIAFVSEPRTVVWGDLADTSSYDTKVSENTYRYIKTVDNATTTDVDDDTIGQETKYLHPDGASTSSTQADFLTHAYTTSGTYALAVDSVPANQYRADRISTIAAPTGSDTSSDVEVTCVAWFEGCDLNVVNGTTLQAVGASMKFYSRLD